MGVAKTVQLSARAASSALLAFEVGGIIYDSSAIMGQPVRPFDFAGFYATLGIQTEPSDSVPIGTVYGGFRPILNPSTPYLLNSSDLDAQIGLNGLMRLRAEPVKALLDKSCLGRANLYLNKYHYTSDIKSRAQEYYTGTDSKANALTQLQEFAYSQTAALAAAYTTDQIADGGEAGVVRQTSYAETSIYGNDTDSTATSFQGSPYRHPYLETLAQGTRAQLSLNDERFANYLATLSVNDIDEILNNELASVDQDVRRIQAAYISTILFAPIAGTVTAIYKRKGEFVMAGEPVLRIENNDSLSITGRLIYNGLISLGGSIAINTALFGNVPITLNGTVTAARCSGTLGLDNTWIVVLECSNLDANGEHILPLNYRFNDLATVVDFL